MFFPKSTKWGAPIFTGYPAIPHSPKIGLSGVCGQSSQVFPKSREIRKPTKGPRKGQL